MTVLLYFLNTLCHVGQNTLGKQYAKRGGVATVFNLNKAAAGLVLFGILGFIQGFSFHLPTVVLGASYGILLCISMHTGFKALDLGPMALTSILVSFSLLIPFFFGICFWNESITLWGVCGILLVMLSIVLINGQRVGGVSCKWLLYALATLVTNGVCSILQKYHQLLFPGFYRTEFTVFSLAIVLILLSAASFTKPDRSHLSFSVLGAIAGLLNCSSNYIVLYLSATENASVLFPIVSVVNIAAAWVAGILFFKEKLTVLQAIGLILGAVSIVLLKL